MQRAYNMEQVTIKRNNYPLRSAITHDGAMQCGFPATIEKTQKMY